MPSYQPFEVQRRAHKAFLVDGYKKGLLFWSRRVGKTLWSVQQLMMSCMLHQGPHHIVFKEYQQAETVAWNQYLHLIPKGLIAEKNKTTLTVTFNYFDGWVKLPEPIGKIELTPDFDKPPASIRLLGSDKADSHRGGESYGMIFDEYQDQDQEAWEYVYSPFFATTDGWSCFMGTAKSYDWWNEMLERAETNHDKSIQKLKDGGAIDLQDWYYSRATWRSNPHVSPEWVAARRKEAESEGKLGPFLQEMELIPFTLQGAVYEMYNKKIHHIDATDIPKEGTDYIGLDFGFAEGHPMAATFVRITREDVWYQWDEIHGTQIHIDDLIAEIRTKMGDRRLTAIIADSARPDLVEYMQSKGLPVIPAPKQQNSVTTGIALMAQMLKPKIQIYGEPKPNYFIDTENCPATHYDFTHYRYKEVKQQRPPDENPDKRYDDSMDALRYLKLWMKFGQVKEDKLPQASMTRELNAYGLL